MKRQSPSSPERVRSWLVEAIRFYRELGFFSRQSNMSDASIADVIESYQQAAPEPFVADRPYSDMLLLRYDPHRVVFEDLTKRIRWGKDRYKSVLAGLAHVSRGSFNPQELHEDPAGPGQVQVEFQLNGRPLQILAKELDHRFDMMVLVQLNLAMFESPYRFEVIDPANGQVFITALTAHERTLIESQRRLPFYVLDLVRMLRPVGQLGRGRPIPGPSLDFVGTLNEFADRSLGKLHLVLKQGAEVTGTFRYYGTDHSERFEFIGRWSAEQRILGGSFRGSIRMAEVHVGEEDRFHPYLGTWVGEFTDDLQVAFGTWRGWLADDGGEDGPEDPSLVALGQWGVIDEELLGAEIPYLRRLKRWFGQVWGARCADDYPMTVSQGLHL